MQIKLIVTRKVLHLAPFWKPHILELENDLLRQRLLLLLVKKMRKNIGEKNLPCDFALISIDWSASVN